MHRCSLSHLQIFTIKYLLEHTTSSRCAHINFNNEIITLLCKIAINRQIEEITKKTEIYRGATPAVRLEFVY